MNAPLKLMLEDFDSLPRRLFYVQRQDRLVNQGLSSSSPPCDHQFTSPKNRLTTLTRRKCLR